MRSLASSLSAAILDDVKLREVFDAIDTHHTGTINPGELRAALGETGKQMTQEAIDSIFSATDGDGSKEISFDEFLAIMKGPTSAAGSVIGQRLQALGDGAAAVRLKKLQVKPTDEMGHRRDGDGPSPARMSRKTATVMWRSLADDKLTVSGSR